MTSSRSLITVVLCLALGACSSGGSRRPPPAGAGDDGGGITQGEPSADARGGEGGSAGDGGGSGQGGEPGAPDSGPPAPDVADEESDAAGAEDGASADGAAPGSVDWTSCGDPKQETKAGVSSADFCAEYASVCGFGKGMGNYADLKACLAAYEGRDSHMYSEGKRLCVAYTVCAIGNKTLRPTLCGVPNIYRCGHRDESAP